MICVTRRFPARVVAIPVAHHIPSLQKTGPGIRHLVSSGPCVWLCVRPPAQSVDVPRHDLHDDALELRQILRRRGRDGIRWARVRSPALRLLPGPARRTPASGGHPTLLGQDVLGQIVAGYGGARTTGRRLPSLIGAPTDALPCPPGRAWRSLGLGRGSNGPFRTARTIRRPHLLLEGRHDIRRAKHARAPTFRLAIYFIHCGGNILSQRHPMTRPAGRRHHSHTLL